jgi:hypothetical protein
MNAILNERCHIAEAVNVTVISLDAAPQGYQDFDDGTAKKFASTRRGCSSAGGVSPRSTTPGTSPEDRHRTVLRRRTGSPLERRRFSRAIRPARCG